MRNEVNVGDSNLCFLFTNHDFRVEMEVDNHNERLLRRLKESMLDILIDNICGEVSPRAQES